MGKIEKINKLAEKGKTNQLAAFVKDKDKNVRLAAIEGLRKVPETEESLNALIGLEDDNDVEIRKAVAITLGHSHGSYVETHLRYRLSHETDENVLAAIRESLANIKQEAQ
ncbi:MAG: HEAT repeat domain-containing protein [Clostridiales bacterium]|nr:HEAT repeat domain-containing protein [Clostridiales bacterium]